MEPGTRQMKFFDTKLQMFGNLNFVQKFTNSQIETPDPFPGVCRDYTRGYEPGEVGWQYWPPEYWCYSLKHRWAWFSNRVLMLFKTTRHLAAKAQYAEPANM
jgi:hypothetical protein